MSVQFILGRSGTGKTRRCMEAIVNALSDPADSQNLILLVPEQATYQAERAILSGGKVPGYHRLHVLSFDRLVYMLLGRRTAKPAVSQIGRNMIIQRVLLENQDKLHVLGRSSAGPGIARRMAQTIAEMQQHGNTPEDIEQSQERLKKNGADDLISEKFRDITLIYEKYLKFIEGKSLDPDMQLMQACRQVAKSDVIRDARLWVDGFAGFTGAELEMLDKLLCTAADAQIALCLDPSGVDLANPSEENIDPAGLFNPTELTYAVLIARIKKAKLGIERPLIFDKPRRFAGCPQLAHIERSIFQAGSAKIPAGVNIRIVSAANARAEAQFVATEILRIVREQNYRYRDIAVVASDIENYEHYIRAYFGDYGIPVFIDKRKRLNQHPLVEMICSALQTVITGFSGSDIFAYLKTDLVPIGRSDVDLLENYCIAFGVTGNDWIDSKQWRFAGEKDELYDEQRVNDVRQKAVAPLLKLKQRFIPENAGEKTIGAQEFAKGIFDFLDKLGVCRQMQQWIEQADREKDYAAADEHHQLYDRLVDVFDEIVDVFADCPMKCEDYLAVLNSALSDLALAFIPPNLDQVLVGSIERSRHPELKAVFLIGATAKQFPVPLYSAGVLTEDDQTAAQSANLTLAPSARQELASRQYLAYIAFTRPCRYLCVTYPAVDEDGSAIQRSQFVDNLQSLFDGLAEQSVITEQFGADEIRSRYDLEDFLCRRLGKENRQGRAADNAGLAGLLDEVCRDTQLAQVGERVLLAINYDNCAQLEKPVVEQLFAGDLRTSASKLTSFAACPYRYFAHYVLGLEKREEFKLEPIDLGIFYHRVLDAVTKTINGRKLDLGTIADKDLLQILSEQIEKITAEDSFIQSFARHSRHNSFIIVSAAEAIQDCVLAVAQMVRAGRFRPALSEMSFGQAENATETLGDFVIDLPQGRKLFLNGKIDRIDVGKINGRKVAVVFDYKKSTYTASFSWSEFVHGLEIQLPVYMLAVRNAEKITDEVAGAFYLPIEVGAKQVSLDEYPPQQSRFAHKAKGIFNGEFFRDLDSTIETGRSRFYNFAVTAKDRQYGYFSTSGVLKPGDFEVVLAYAGRKIVELAEQISSGLIEVRPYRMGNKSPCGHCDYKALCRFDWQVNAYRHLEQVSKQDALGVIGADNAGKRD